MQNTVISTRSTSLCGFQPSSVVLCIENSDFRTKLLVSMGPRLHQWFCTCKTECLPSELLFPRYPALICGFCIQNSDFWIRITSLYGSQTSPVDLSMQNSVISIRLTSLCGSQPSSVVFACKTESFGPELQVSMSRRPHLSLCACKTAWLAPEILVSMGPSPHLWFLHANSDVWSRITSPYGSQTSLVVLCMPNSVIITRNTSLY